MLAAREDVEQDGLAERQERRARGALHRRARTPGASSDCDRPHISVATEKPARLQNCTLPRPNRPTSQPVIGVHTAVARMLKVTVQEISSCVAAMAPCICGRMAVAVNVAAL